MMMSVDVEVLWPGIQVMGRDLVCLITYDGVLMG
jgi:hypothetical protein